MLGSQILEVAIGIVFIYILLSIICSAVTEFFAAVFALRAHNLEQGIRNILNDPAGKGLAEEFYSHPLITGLVRRNRTLGGSARMGKPSYIPSENFALAVLDIISKAASLARPQTLETLRLQVDECDYSDLKRWLLPLIDEAKEDLDKARANIRKWFDNAMDRASGWYKRKTNSILFVIAVVLSILLNADTLMIANRLYGDTALRAAVLAAAEKAGQEPPSESAGQSLDRITEIRAELQEIGIPLGWTFVKKDHHVLPVLPDGGGPWIAKILGLLLTAVAISRGAPFWFQLLNKLINLRLTGKQPESSTDKKGRKE